MSIRCILLLFSVIFCLSNFALAKENATVRNSHPHYGMPRSNNRHIIPLTITNNSCLGNLEIRITQNDKFGVFQHDKQHDTLLIQGVNVCNGSSIISIEDPIWPVTLYIPSLSQKKTYDKSHPNAVINGSIDCLKIRPNSTLTQPGKPGHHILASSVPTTHALKVSQPHQQTHSKLN